MTSGPRSKRKAMTTDVLVGANVRRLRIEVGLTLASMADDLGVSHQQLQKYETGANRISAGMLYQLAELFAVDINSLFEGVKELADDDSAAATARRKCHSLIDRTTSTATLESMAKVLKAMSGD